MRSCKSAQPGLVFALVLAMTTVQHIWYAVATRNGPHSPPERLPGPVSARFAERRPTRIAPESLSVESDGLRARRTFRRAPAASDSSPAANSGPAPPRSRPSGPASAPRRCPVPGAPRMGERGRGRPRLARNAARRPGIAMSGRFCRGSARLDRRGSRLGGFRAICGERPCAAVQARLGQRPLPRRSRVVQRWPEVCRAARPRIVGQGEQPAGRVARPVADLDQGHVSGRRQGEFADLMQRPRLLPAPPSGPSPLHAAHHSR